MIAPFCHTTKTENATLSKLRAAQSVSQKSPKLFSGWQLRMYTLGCRFVSRWPTGGQSTFGQHADCFRNPRVLANAVPLGFCSGGFSSTSGYDPATSAQLSSSHSLPSAGPLQRVPLVLIRVARESLATFSSKAFRLRLKASIGLTVRLSFLSSVCHHIGCRSFCRSRRP
jgi:hypothetical protein